MPLPPLPPTPTSARPPCLPERYAPNSLSDGLEGLLRNVNVLIGTAHDAFDRTETLRARTERLETVAESLMQLVDSQQSEIGTLRYALDAQTVRINELVDLTRAAPAQEAAPAVPTQQTPRAPGRRRSPSASQVSGSGPAPTPVVPSTGTSGSAAEAPRATVMAGGGPSLNLTPVSPPSNASLNTPVNTPVNTPAAMPPMDRSTPHTASPPVVSVLPSEQATPQPAPSMPSARTTDSAPNSNGQPPQPVAPTGTLPPSSTSSPAATATPRTPDQLRDDIRNAIRLFAARFGMPGATALMQRLTGIQGRTPRVPEIPDDQLRTVLTGIEAESRV